MTASVTFARLVDFACSVSEDCMFHLTLTTDFGDIISFHIRNYTEWMRETCVVRKKPEPPRQIHGWYKIVRDNNCIYSKEVESSTEAISIFDTAILPWIHTIEKSNIHLDTDFADKSIDNLVIATTGAELVWDILCHLIAMGRIHSVYKPPSYAILQRTY